MDLRVTNLGPIRDVTLPIRPFTVILGPNHVGKTWLAYAVYAAMSGPVEPEQDAYVRNADEEQGLRGAVREIVSERMTNAARQLPVVYQDRTIRTSAATISLDVRDEALDTALTQAARKLPPLVRALTFPDSEGARTGISGRTLAEEEYLVTECVRRLLVAPFALPAERNALVLTYKMLAQRRLKTLILARRSSFGLGYEKDGTRAMKQEALYRELGELRFPQPVEDFLEFLFACELDDLAREPDDVSSLADLLERHALDGNRLQWETVGQTARELMLQLPDAPALDLYNASSAVKQLAPLLLWLRHGHPGGLLIIDEPELNLHPITQARLLEALAILVKLGKKVLITTHSPYFMAHLNNLIAGSAQDEGLRGRQAKHLYLQDPRAFLRPQDVGAWQMDTDGLHDLYEPEWGIRWDTLSDASAELQRLYFAIRREEEGGDADG